MVQKIRAGFAARAPEAEYEKIQASGSKIKARA
jgi:hypothetical protein